MTRPFFLTSVLPFPTSGGADLRAWNIIQGLAAIGPTSVFAMADRPGPRPTIDGLVRWDASRALSPAEVGTRHQRMWAAPKEGSRLSDAYFEPDTEAQLTAALIEDQPDVVVLDALYGGSYLDAINAYRGGVTHQVRVVHNSHNVEGALARDIADSETVMPLRVLRKVLATSTETVESDVLDASDVVWVCSEPDAAGFASHYGWSKPAVVVPNVVDVPTYDDVYTRQSTAPGRGMIFPATFSYPPNEVAARFLLDEVAPLVPDLPLILAGAGPPPSLVEAARDRALVTGSVPDMRTHLAEAAVMAVPLFEGGGTRLKVLEGFAAGLPVVASRKAVEGLDVTDGRHLLLAETPDAFAAALEQAIEPDTAARLRREGRQLVEESYSVAAVARTLRAALS